MIHFIATAGFLVTARVFLDDPGRHWADRIRLLDYGQAVRETTPAAGTWIFGDVERLSPAMTERAADLARRIADRPDTRILNHPVRSMRRYELLRALHADGTNPHDVYRLTEHRVPAHWPVFVRRDDGHEGPLSRLLHDPREFERVRAAADGEPYDRHTLLAVEFCDTRSPDGLYRRYSAWRVGEALFCPGIALSRAWAAKVTELAPPSHVAFENAYIDAFPDRERTLALFERARIAFGRMDYAFHGARLVVWEINTNPGWFPSTLAKPEMADRRRRYLDNFERALSTLL